MEFPRMYTSGSHDKSGLNPLNANQHTAVTLARRLMSVPLNTALSLPHLLSSYEFSFTFLLELDGKCHQAKKKTFICVYLTAALQISCDLYL